MLKAFKLVFSEQVDAWSLMFPVLMRLMVSDLIWAVVSLKSKAAPTFCGHAFSWDFYSGTSWFLLLLHVSVVHNRENFESKALFCILCNELWVCFNTDVSRRQPACAEMYTSKRTAKNPRPQMPIRQTFGFMKKWRSICHAPVIDLVLSYWLVCTIRGLVTNK